MGVTNSNSHGPLDPQRLAAFEQRIGSALPGDYRGFLLAHNGGSLVPEEIVMPEQSEPFTLLMNPTFGLHGASGDLEVVYDNCRDALPADLIAFAEDHGGNLFCIGIRGANVGRIYFWDHNRSSPGHDEPDWSGVTILAGEFSGFANHLGRTQPGE